MSKKKQATSKADTPPLAAMGAVLGVKDIERAIRRVSPEEVAEIVANS